MKQATITLAVRTPAQIGVRIDSPLSGLAKKIRPAERQYAAYNAAERHLVYGQRGLASTAPNLLVRIGEERGLYLREPRALIGTIFVGDSFDPEKLRRHYFRSPKKIARIRF
jgi:hypothetical protein